eukprot:TRINITY_DN7160_c0_g1_i1.p1 TRINITY_DN7160_c0_g1~~TRINITY_DN7160_c0_g1_i1.p1  ORF type:complete len:647 (-),score=63.82 TRINITY_DN7160_c0_g1_i1:51-1991(-)
MIRLVFVVWFTSLVYASRTARQVNVGGHSSAWPHFSLGKSCGICSLGPDKGSIKVQDLKRYEDFAVGCISRRLDFVASLKECPMASGKSDQAGGHAGTIHRLTSGRIAKLTMAFDDAQIDNHDPAHIEASAVEFETYMEMWCLKRLANLMPGDAELLREHPLWNFAVGVDPWAPSFFGVCKLPGENANRPLLYLVMENMLAPFSKACELDLKLGFQTVEHEERPRHNSVLGKGRGIVKRAKLKFADRVSPSAMQGARMAGYKIFNPFQNVFEKPSSKWADPLTSLTDVFGKFLDDSGHVADTETMEIFRDRLLGMAAWWAESGEKRLRAIALSALFAYECAPQYRGELILSDLSISGPKWPLVAAKARGQVNSTLLSLKSSPADTILPKFGPTASPESTGANASDLRRRLMNRAMGARAAQAVHAFTAHQDATSELPAWKGKVFDIAYVQAAHEISVIIQANIGQEEVYQGKISLPIRMLPVGSNSKCVLIELPGENKVNKAPPKMCFRYVHTQQTVSPIAKPRLKLIDFAHFFSASSLTTAWPKDGVHEGLLSALGELDKKIVAATYRDREDGHFMKCPHTTAQSFSNILTLATCRNYGKMRKKKYISWRATAGELGECRACDALVRRRMTGSMETSSYRILTLI